MGKDKTAGESILHKVLRKQKRTQKSKLLTLFQNDKFLLYLIIFFFKLKKIKSKVSGKILQNYFY